MKRVPGYFVSLALVLTACTAQAVAPSAMPLASATSAPPTATPSTAPTVTPNIPTIDVDGVQVPDPKVSNPELFDITKSDSPIPQFINAMNVVGVNVTTKDIQDIVSNGDKLQEKKTAKGETYYEFTYKATDKQGTDYSIRFIYDEEGGWRLFTFKDAEKIDGTRMGTTLASRSEVIDYGQSVADQLNALVVKNYSHAIITDFSWTFFDDGRYDQDLALAKANNMTSEGDDLIYPLQNFKYIALLKDFKSNAEKDGLSPEEMRQKLIQIMTGHIQQVIDAAKGRVEQWSVVNEHNKTDDQYYQIVGDDYVDIAFQTARQADPSASLYYNDDGNETRNGPNYQQDLAVIKKLKDKGLIDAIGLQMHIKADNPPTKEELIATMQSYGIPVIVSSLDINMRDVAGSPEARNQRQAQIGVMLIAACRESGVCSDIYWWDGFGDKYNWLYSDTPHGDKYGPNVDPTPFTTDGHYKPVFWAMIDALNQ